MLLAVAPMPAWLSGEARAACDPAAANDVIATCTGATTDQGPAAVTGYGDPALTNLSVTVEPSATVTGTVFGIVFNNGTVYNFGAISGGSFGIRADAEATLTNSGTVWGSTFGIYTDTDATVTNSGTLSAGAGGFRHLRHRQRHRDQFRRHLGRQFVVSMPAPTPPSPIPAPSRRTPTAS